MATRDEQLEQLTAYLDGEVSDAERAEIDAMLARDPAARTLFDELRSVSTMVAELPRATAPASLADSVITRIERESLFDQTKTARGWRIGNWIALAASFALFVVAGWWMWPGQPMPERVAMNTTSLETANDKIAAIDESAGEWRQPAGSAVQPLTDTRGGGAAEAGRDYAMTEDHRNRLARTTVDTSVESKMRAGNRISLSEAAPIDQGLNYGDLTCETLVKAQPSEFTNQVVVEVPNNRDVSVLGGVFEATLAMNSARNLDAAAPSESVPPDRSFFANTTSGRQSNAAKQRDNKKTDMSESPSLAFDDDDDESVKLVLNVRRDEVPALFAMVQQTATQREISANWLINGNSYSNGVPSATMAEQLVVVDRAEVDSDLGQPGASRKQKVRGRLRDDREEITRAASKPMPTAKSPNGAKIEQSKSNKDEDDIANAGPEKNGEVHRGEERKEAEAEPPSKSNRPVDKSKQELVGPPRPRARAGADQPEPTAAPEQPDRATDRRIEAEATSDEFADAESGFEANERFKTRLDDDADRPSADEYVTVCVTIRPQRAILGIPATATTMPVTGRAGSATASQPTTRPADGAPADGG